MKPDEMSIVDKVTINEATIDEVSSTRHMAYTAKEWSEKKIEYPWLISTKGYIGCSICKNISNLQAFKSIGVAISPEWRDCSVIVTGSTKADQMKTIRKKMSKHKLSAAHIRADEISRSVEKSTLPNLVDQMNSAHIESTMKIFRTVYLIAKNNRPLTDHPQLILLQQLNGSDMGLSLHSRYFYKKMGYPGLCLYLFLKRKQ
jgi:hypothetical protein